MKPEPFDNVRANVKETNLGVEIRVLAADASRTSSLAAESLRCSVAEIAKTIGFVGIKNGSSPVLVVLSGDRKVNLRKLASALSLAEGELRKMSAEEVKALTEYVIGGVPPFPHKRPVLVLADESLFRFSKVWAAAGSANTVMSLNPSLLTIELAISRVDVSE